VLTRHARSAMAAPNIDAVVALTHKAQELERKGHFARAVEKWSGAVAAAQVLQQPDCLIVAALQLKQASARQVSTRSEPLPVVKAVIFETVHQCAAAASTALRRSAARTLLPGACRPWEVAWSAAYHDKMRALAQPAERSFGLPQSAADEALCVVCAPRPCALADQALTPRRAAR
jgi:hypothetical protein